MINEIDFISFLSVKRGLARSSLKHCRIRIGVFNRWLEENKKEISKETVEEFFLDLKNKGLNNNSLNTYYFCLRQLRDYLADRGRDNDFLQGFKNFSKVRPLIEILTQEEVTRLLEVHLEYGKFRGLDTSVLDFIYGTVNMFLAHTGARFDECASLTLKHLDLSMGKVTFVETKNKEIRRVYISDPLLTRLKTLCRGKLPEDYVFTNFMGKKIRPQEYDPDLKKRAVKAGITKRVHAHLFRHTYATHLYMATGDIGMAQVVLGHRDIKSTQIYIHIADELVKKAMYRHPFVRSYIHPKETLTELEERIHSFKLQDDPRFDFIKVSTAIKQFSMNLYGAIKSA